MEDEKTSSNEAPPSNITENGVNTIGLNSLQGKEQLELLNEIDKLRSHGVSDFVSLPQLVVCGDQSSGKSSVLEAITEIPFPRSSTLCTRFATQLILRRTAITKARVYIIPDSLRKGAEREKLASFAGVISDFSELPQLVEKAKVAMGLDNGDGAFSRDTLSIEVCGPDKPQLTIVDLPGLIHSENKLQSKADVELVSELVHRYMMDQRTIILAVVTAKNDYANQIVLKRAKEADPEGIRTLGIITKPDTLPAGSDSEKDFVNLAKNKDIFFKLGWHVIRNRGYEERDCTFAERNRLEREFFAQGAWAGVETGIDSLRTRLSNLLLNHIKRELPQVHQEIFNGLKECENELKLLGQRRTTTEEQRTLLFRVSELFGSITKSAVEGTYENPFFGLIEQDEGRKKRLRAHVQALNKAFAEKMRLEGHSRYIVETEEEKESIGTNRPEVITRKQAIEWVRPLLVGGRGRELPGTFNPLLISELFWEQSKDWGKIAAKHLKKIFRRLQEFLRIALRDLAPSDVIDSLLAYHIDIKMAERLEKASRELENLLEDRRRHAITYNHYYTDNVQKIRHDRFKERTARLLENISDSSPVQMTKEAILNALAAPVEVDMDEYACQEALDSMLAYYKVAYKTFVDNVSIIVIERQLLNDLWGVFSPTSVMGMTADVVAAICAEAPEDKKRREQLEIKLSSLKGGLEVCSRALRGVKFGTKYVLDDSDSESDSEDEVATKASPHSRAASKEAQASTTPAAPQWLFRAKSAKPQPGLFQSPASNAASASSPFGNIASNADPAFSNLASKATPTSTQFGNLASNAGPAFSNLASKATPTSTQFGNPASNASPAAGSSPFKTVPFGNPSSTKSTDLFSGNSRGKRPSSQERQRHSEER